MIRHAIIAPALAMLLTSCGPSTPAEPDPPATSDGPGRSFSSSSSDGRGPLDPSIEPLSPPPKLDEKLFRPLPPAPPASVPAPTPSPPPAPAPAQ
ncbi:MAG: hypothetical protein ABL882_11225 [Sphingopyxis sp.]